MEKDENLSVNIDKLRERLEYLIEIKGSNLMDDEIIYASKLLNEALNKYNNLVYRL